MTFLIYFNVVYALLVVLLLSWVILVVVLCCAGGFVLCLFGVGGLGLCLLAVACFECWVWCLISAVCLDAGCCLVSWFGLC